MNTNTTLPSVIKILHVFYLCNFTCSIESQNRFEIIHWPHFVGDEFGSYRDLVYWTNRFWIQDTRITVYVMYMYICITVYVYMYYRITHVIYLAISFYMFFIKLRCILLQGRPRDSEPFSLTYETTDKELYWRFQIHHILLFFQQQILFKQQDLILDFLVLQSSTVDLPTFKSNAILEALFWVLLEDETLLS